MKIVQLDIEGFRSLKNISWKPGDLNVIIGPNGSGKSNLMRMLEMISAAAQGGLSNYVKKEGGTSALLWDGVASSLKWRLTAVPEGDVPAYSLSYAVELLKSVSDFSSFDVYEEQLDKQELLTNSPNASPVRQLSRHSLTNRIIGDGSVQEIGRGMMPAQETLLSIAAGPLSVSELLTYVQQQITFWSIHHDLGTDSGSTIRQSAVSRLETKVASDGQNLINVLHTLYTGDREFKRQVNSAMRAAFGDAFDELVFPPASDQRIQMRVRWKTLKREQSAADLSDGTLRFLFLLAVLANPTPPSLIAIDEPETGLHPSMLPLVAELAVDAAERTQVVFTTHSDLFLDAFRVTETRPTTTVARWENGETTLTTLADEDLEYWLKDYSLGKMFRSGELESLA